jgi:hypothetical protein
VEESLCITYPKLNIKAFPKACDSSKIFNRSSVKYILWLPSLARTGTVTECPFCNLLFDFLQIDVYKLYDICACLYVHFRKSFYSDKF